MFILNHKIGKASVSNDAKAAFIETIFVEINKK